FLTLIERKFLGYTQLQKGPNAISLYGLLQSIAGALKPGFPNMNSSSPILTTNQYKARCTIHASYIKPSSLFHHLIWISFKFKIYTYQSSMGKTNQAPFALTEGESELISDFNVEYIAWSFTMFLAEYANIIIIKMSTTILFLGTFHNPYISELHTIASLKHFF
ncbi:hypothetical protein EI555_008179, partial [Monodon monoceros]